MKPLLLSSLLLPPRPAAYSLGTQLTGANRLHKRLIVGQTQLFSDSNTQKVEHLQKTKYYWANSLKLLGPNFEKKCEIFFLVWFCRNTGFTISYGLHCTNNTILHLLWGIVCSPSFIPLLVGVLVWEVSAQGLLLPKATFSAAHWLQRHTSLAMPCPLTANPQRNIPFFF